MLKTNVYDMSGCDTYFGIMFVQLQCLVDIFVSVFGMPQIGMTRVRIR